MIRDAWYRFTFEDGFSVICMGLSPIMAGKYRDEHGRITNKEFVAWDDELTVGDVVDMDGFFGGGKNAETCD